MSGKTKEDLDQELSQRFYYAVKANNYDEAFACVEEARNHSATGKELGWKGRTWRIYYEQTSYIGGYDPVMWATHYGSPRLLQLVHDFETVTDLPNHGRRFRNYDALKLAQSKHDWPVVATLIKHLNIRLHHGAYADKSSWRIVGEVESSRDYQLWKKDASISTQADESRAEELSRIREKETKSIAASLRRLHQLMPALISRGSLGVLKQEGTDAKDLVISLEVIIETLKAEVETKKQQLKSAHTKNTVLKAEVVQLETRIEELERQRSRYATGAGAGAGAGRGGLSIRELREAMRVSGTNSASAAAQAGDGPGLFAGAQQMSRPQAPMSPSSPYPSGAGLKRA